MAGWRPVIDTLLRPRRGQAKLKSQGRDGMQTAVITSRPHGCHRVAFAQNAAAASQCHGL
jgi:hypothetical protein